MPTPPPFAPEGASLGRCRTCSRQLFSVLNLGEMSLPWFPAGDEPVPTAPLHLCVCDGCALVQLSDTVDPALLYKQYWYRSGINEAMRAELTSVVQAALLDVSVFPQDLVIDIGANDGYLLSQYPKQRAHWEATRVGFEPAQNLREHCAAACEVLVPNFFPPVRDMLPGVFNRAKIITAIAMFNHVDDPRRFVQAINGCLHEDGVWIVQFQDLGQQVEATAVDNICHEHVTYWSLASFVWFLERAAPELHVTHVERRLINGGSLRIHVRRISFPVDETVEDLLQEEAHSVGWQALERFAWQAAETKRQIFAAVDAAHRAGQTIDLYGASTKANTLLQYCGLGPTHIRQAWERNTEKFGRRTATGIPIVGEEVGRYEDPPDLLLAGIWQFRATILEREHAFLTAGGGILFPLPEVDLVRGDAPATL
jgi:NDP-4-keto-2,6-dideoxyhexose 3-C-methyltransferase